MTTFCVIAEIVALCGYLCAAVCFPLRLLRPDPDLTKAGSLAWLAAAALQAVGLLAHVGRAGGQAVVGEYANIVFVLVVLLVGATELTQRRTERSAVAAFVAPVVFLLVLTSVFHPRVTLPLVDNPWFVAHILLTLGGYACFGIAFAMAAAYLVNDALLKRKQVLRLRLLPSLEAADNYAHLAVAVGFPIYSLGLAVGAATLLAHGLRPDLKVALSVACWLVFAAYLYLRGLGRARGKRVQMLVLVGFALVVANFVLVRHDAQRLRVSPAARVDR